MNSTQARAFILERRIDSLSKERLAAFLAGDMDKHAELGKELTDVIGQWQSETFQNEDVS